MDSVPFLALSRMDRRQDQIILIELGATGVRAACIGRFKRQLGEKAFTAGMSDRDLLQLFEIAGTCARVLVKPFEMRLIPCPHGTDLPGPGDCAILQISQQAAKLWPGQRRRGEWYTIGELSQIETVLREIQCCFLCAG